jgi:hypothetical protein
LFTYTDFILIKISKIIKISVYIIIFNNG